MTNEEDQPSAQEMVQMASKSSAFTRFAQAVASKVGATARPTSRLRAFIGGAASRDVGAISTYRPVIQKRAAERTFKSTLGGLFPQIPRQSTYVAVGQKTGRRGRPHGTYKVPGGVIRQRKIRAQQKAMQRLIAVQQQMVAQQRQIKQGAQMIRQGPKIPQEIMSENGMTPQQIRDYSRINVPQEQQYSQYTQDQGQGQYPDQYQQYPQQYPQQPQQREIKTVFKSSGGSPYPPVSKIPQNQSPIRSDPNSEYYYDTDAFTGKPIMRRRPQAERWIR